MKLPTPPQDQEERINVKPLNVILKAQGNIHKGSWFALLSNGGTRNVGNFVIEVIASPGDFRTIQIYETGLGIAPQKQKWNRTKTVVQKTIVEKTKKITQPSKTLEVNTQLDEESLL